MPATEFTSTTLSLADGQPCRVWCAGDGPGLLFVHGLPGLATDFLPLARLLAEEFFCVLLDRPGYGGSVPLKSGRIVGVAQNATDVLDVATQLDLQRLSLVGWSYGGPIVAQAASNAPRQVDRLVFLGAAGPAMRWPLNLADRLLYHSGLGSALVKMLGRMGQGYLRRQLEVAVGAPVGDQLFAAFLSGLAQPDTVNTWMKEGAQWAPGETEVSAVQQPSLVIHGDRDRRVDHSVGRDLAARLVDASFVSIAGAGHWPFVTHTDEVLARMRDFLVTKEGC